METGCETKKYGFLCRVSHSKNIHRLGVGEVAEQHSLTGLDLSSNSTIYSDLSTVIPTGPPSCWLFVFLNQQIGDYLDLLYKIIKNVKKHRSSNSIPGVFLVQSTCMFWTFYS